jgi:AAA15 family ATPase/GTPase
MVNSKEGVLFIDEIENGIHYSIQEKLWEKLLELAEKLNVQVFATTHSWDCIDGFQRALNAFHDPSQGQLLRMSMRNDEITATSFDARELAIATRENIEVR